MEAEGVRLGIDLGGTLTKFLVLESGEKRYGESLPTPNGSFADLLRMLAGKARELLSRYPITHIGIGVPGVVRDGRVEADNLPMHGEPMQALLERELGLPVAVDNDASCAALAEANFRKPSCRNLVMVTVGTGIGGGIVLDGEIRRGRGGMGEICHMSIEASGGLPCTCGGRGCWEQYASTTALVRACECAAKEAPGSLLYTLLCEHGGLNGILIFRALREGCPVAGNVFSEYLDRLAVGLRNLAYIFDPDVIVLSGGITRDGDLFLEDLRARVGTDVPIAISVLQSEAGAYGAAMLTRDVVCE